MNEMIERVAARLYALPGTPRVAGAIPDEWKNADAVSAALCRRNARAAIEALHEPTLAMLNRGVAAEEANLTYLEHYHEMISAALTETPASPCPASSPPHAP